MRVRNPVVALIPGVGPVAGATMTTRVRATNADATVYADETSSAPGLNPDISDDHGRCGQWLERGAYKTIVSVLGQDPYTEEWDASPASDGAIDTDWYGDESVTPPKSTLPWALRDTFANRGLYNPATLPTGTAFISSDLGGEWRVVAGAWVQVARMRGALASRPTAAAAGNLGLYEATDVWGTTLYQSNGTSWSVVFSADRMVQTVTGASSVTFAGLDGDTEAGYRIAVVGKHIQGGVTRYATMRPNNDTNGANYVSANGLYAIVGSNSAGALIGPDGGLGISVLAGSINAQANTGDSNFVTQLVLVSKTGGKRIATGQQRRDAQAFYDYGGHWSDTSSNLTSLVFDFGGGTFTGSISVQRLAH